MKLNLNKTSILSVIALSAVFFILASQNVYASVPTNKEILDLVNQARIRENLTPLKINENLQKTAEEKADDMIKNDYFAHKSPGGIEPWFWFKKNGYDYKYAGENLAINFFNAQDQQAAWMKSETHKKNILDPNYNETGIAVREITIKGKHTIITVQEFGLRNAYVAVSTPGKVAGAEKVISVQFVFKDFFQDRLWFVRSFSDSVFASENFLMVWILVAGLSAIIISAGAAIAYVKKKYEMIFLSKEFMAIILGEYLKSASNAKNNSGQMDIIYLGQPRAR